ncbi:MAG TPA: basic secretory protein-like protein [Gemmataceae bacterium]
MHPPTRFALVALAALGALTQPRSPAAAAEPKPVAAVVETSLATADRNIRQFAFDGDPATYFASDKNPATDDHFTLVFDAPVAVKTVAVTTGKPDGADKLDAGALEGSEDGKSFAPLATFADGTARAAADGRKLRAVRVRPGESKHPLVVRDFTVESDPPVAVFKYPVEVAVASDDPEMLPWVTKAARICERQYPMICDELRSDGFKPRTYITMTLKNDYRGVAATGGGRITGSVKFFRDHPDDFGAMVHETVHAVQSYRGRGNPGWLVEGVADYIRFFKYEPGKIGRVNPDRWRYDGAYRQTAAFLNYVAEKYDKDLVRKLNAAMREGKYKDDLWQEMTKKPVKELGEEWKATLKR